MITKRQYFAIFLIFLAVFLLFQGLQIGRMHFNISDENQHFTETEIKGSDAQSRTEFTELYEDSDGTPVQKENIADEINGEYVVFVGGKESSIAKTVKEWAYYTRRSIVYSETVPDWESSPYPDMIILEKGTADGNEITLMHHLEHGTDVLFTEVPDCEYISSHNLMRRILGIYKIYQESVTLHGIRLFKGFFLGGDRLFELDDDAPEEDLPIQDLDLEKPWYVVRPATETYMQGTLSKDELTEFLKTRENKKNQKYNEDLPAIVWRSHFRGGDVFAVCGDYMQDRRIGLGMLEAFMNQRTDTDIYPIVNSHVFSLCNFPIMADENNDQVEAIYGSPISKAQTDIIMPMLVSLTSQYDVKPSCFMSVKHDYDDDAQPANGSLKYYLEQFYEMDCELGVSAVRRGRMLLADKLASDYKYYTDDNQKYDIHAAFLDPSEKVSFVAQYKKSRAWDKLVTVSFSAYSDKNYVVGYMNNDITYQQTTNDLNYHTYTDELRLLGVQTLLCYNNSCYDVSKVFKPESRMDEWQNSSRRVFGNLTTYNAPFSAIDELTITESDERVRTFLSVDAQVKREGNVIKMQLSGVESHAYYMLRVHNDKIKTMSGGTFKLLEKDAYILDITENEVEIVLANTLASEVEVIGGNR